MEKILQEIDGEVKKQKQAKASERGSTYSATNKIIKNHKIADPWLNIKQLQKTKGP
jgi:hypothetical protein